MTTPRLITISWRNIPAQVIARDGPDKVSLQLDARFQHAIDRAAGVAGMETADEYLAEWNRHSAECGTDLAREVERAAATLEAEFPPSVLGRYVVNGGFRPDGPRQEDA